MFLIILLLIGYLMILTLTPDWTGGGTDAAVLHHDHYSALAANDLSIQRLIVKSFMAQIVLLISIWRRPSALWVSPHGNLPSDLQYQ